MSVICRAHQQALLLAQAALWLLPLRSFDCAEEVGRVTPAQFKFGSEPPPKTMARQRDKYDAGNLAAAQYVLDDPSKWSGEQAGLVQWVRAVERRLNAKWKGNAP